MGGFDDEIPTPRIPNHVFVIIGCMASLLAGSQLLGLWLIGFKKPTPSEPVYIRASDVKPSSWTLASAGEVALRVPPAAATRVSSEIRKLEEEKRLEEIEEPGEVEDSKENEMTEDTNGSKEIERINEERGPEEVDEMTGIDEKEEITGINDEEETNKKPEI